MGKLKDVCDVLRDAGGILKDIKCTVTDARGMSIARQSSATTLQFPVIMSRSINIDTASNVVKAVERQYAIFVQMVISLNPTIDLNKESIPDYVKRIHQNRPSELDLIESCTNVYSNEEYNLLLFTSINEGCNGTVLQSNKEQLMVIEDCLNQTKLNDLYKPKQITMSVAESSLDYFCRKNDIVTEAKVRSGDINAVRNNSRTADVELRKLTLQNTINNQELQFRQQRQNFDFQQQKHRDDMDAKSAQLNFQKTKYEEDKIYRAQKDLEEKEMDKVRFQREIDRADAENRSRTIVRLSDNDVKKANELVPTTLTVSLQQVKGDNFGSLVNFVLGVKGLMHPVNSAEMVSNLVDGYKAGNKFFNFLRWTSGEISFLKDLILNVKGIKEDVIKKHSKGSHWWTTLKRNRMLSRIKNTYGKQKILPNTTIVCSMEEIMEMKDTYGIDLMEPKNVMKLMDRYFLLGFVIVDEAQELTYFMFDGEREFQALSFNGLERENNDKNNFKDIYKMINMGRL